jgi:hypothetical protein
MSGGDAGDPLRVFFKPHPWHGVALGDDAR